MVANTNKDADTSTIGTPKQKEHTVPSSGPQCCAPPVKVDVLTPLSLVREHLQSQGISFSAFNIIIMNHAVLAYKHKGPVQILY